MVSLTNFRSVGEVNSATSLANSSARPRVDLSPEHELEGSPRAFESPEKTSYQITLPPTATNQQQPLDDRGGIFHTKKSLMSQQQQHRDHFKIRWTNLTYQVEPKWYRQKWDSLTGSGQSSHHSGGQDDSAGESASSSSSSSTSTYKANGSGGRKSPLPANRRTTKILDELSGTVESGQVTAILGPSGAGKTTLLGCLTGKNKSGVSGCVEVISNRTEPMSICTIPQKDYLLNQLTVRENLYYASRLKHPQRKFDHDTNIERVVELLKLETCIDTKISKISGGQYKRVSIAQELLSNPDILILDEPTSGLDSLTCYKTVMVLRDLARLSPNPMAIIVTIHQPQREVFELFNHVYILAVGGRCIYEGQPSMCIDTINRHSNGLHFDASQYNPASYMVEIASGEFGQKAIESLIGHQAREFRRLILEQTADDFGQSWTPGPRKRASPMVARLKCKLSSLTGAHSPRLGPKSPQPGAKSAHHPLRSYTNEAFEEQHHSGQHQPKQLAIPVISVGGPPDSNQVAQDQQHHHHHQMDHLGPPDARGVAANENPWQWAEEGEFYLDQRLQTHKHDHSGHFLRHCQLLTQRSWLCLRKDPMLTTLRFTAHILVPLLITLVYGSRVGKPNACPLYESDMDLVEYAKTGPKRLMQLQTDLRCTFENVGLYFLSIYAFTFSTMCLTSLSFPLNMHVLLKEVRNGWYSIPTYYIGKSLADFPLEFILPTVTLIITYPLTGQPSSAYEWRFLVATGVFVVTSLIAQTQGLIFGALFMNAMQAAVFVAPVSTTPLILLSGFLIRISQMPSYLQTLSCFSYFRYAIESLTIIRYGFGQCPCDSERVNGKPVTASGLPEQLRTMANYWISTFQTPDSNSLLDATTSGANSTGVVSVQPIGDASPNDTDFFQDLTVMLARANSFGTDIRTCEDLKPYPMIDFGLEDSQLYGWLYALFATLVAMKVLNYLVVKYSVKWRL